MQVETITLAALQKRDMGQKAWLTAPVPGIFSSLTSCQQNYNLIWCPSLQGDSAKWDHTPNSKNK